MKKTTLKKKKTPKTKSQPKKTSHNKGQTKTSTTEEASEDHHYHSITEDGVILLKIIPKESEEWKQMSAAERKDYANTLLDKLPEFAAKLDAHRRGLLREISELKDRLSSLSYRYDHLKSHELCIQSRMTDDDFATDLYTLDDPTLFGKVSAARALGHTVELCSRQPQGPLTVVARPIQFMDEDGDISFP